MAAIGLTLAGEGSAREALISSAPEEILSLSITFLMHIIIPTIIVGVLLRSIQPKNWRSENGLDDIEAETQ